MNAFQRFVFNLFVCCCAFCFILFIKLDSYAEVGIYTASGNINDVWQFDHTWYGNHNLDNERYAFYWTGPSVSPVLYCSIDPSSITVHQTRTGIGNNSSAGVTTSDLIVTFSHVVEFHIYIENHNNNLYWGYKDFSSNVPIFSDFNDMVTYLTTGVMPEVEFDSSLELDSFKVTSWSIGNLQALFKSKFEVKWSDSRISVVQVRITGTANDVTYESSSSPFNGKFQASQFVIQKGDVIHLVATPFKGDGSYGQSLYYSVTYSDNIPFSNNYRKLVNNNTNDNTLTIPYSGSSGNDTVTLPVDGVTTNVTYKVNYNPVTNEYGDVNLYEIYYSPVVVYPDYVSEQEVDDTQDIINNNYNTTNYYETTKNINLSFDIDFGDISTNDIGEGFNGVSGFFNGFGGFIGRLSNWILALFPFLPPIVANSIVFMFGLVILIAGIALILKIIGAVGNIIDAILPL